MKHRMKIVWAFFFVAFQMYALPEDFALVEKPVESEKATEEKQSAERLAQEALAAHAASFKPSAARAVFGVPTHDIVAKFSANFSKSLASQDQSNLATAIDRAKTSGSYEDLENLENLLAVIIVAYKDPEQSFSVSNFLSDLQKNMRFGSSITDKIATVFNYAHLQLAHAVTAVRPEVGASVLQGRVLQASAKVDFAAQIEAQAKSDLEDLMQRKAQAERDFAETKAKFESFKATYPDIEQRHIVTDFYIDQQPEYERSASEKLYLQSNQLEDDMLNAQDNIALYSKMIDSASQAYEKAQADTKVKTAAKMQVKMQARAQAEAAKRLLPSESTGFED